MRWQTIKKWFGKGDTTKIIIFSGGLYLAFPKVLTHINGFTQGLQFP